MFSFSAVPIDANELKARLANAKAGAVSTFEGLVRNHNDGRSVLSLEYEAYEALALKEAAKIIEEAKQKFAVYDVVCVHRTGALAIADMAVFVGVSSAHRGTAFDACRYIIDEIKSRLPIWKKETYTDGSSGWVNCQNCAHPHSHQEAATTTPSAHPPAVGNPQSAHNEQEYYSRQTILPAVRESGQSRLRSAKVLVIGAGGLGCPALLYLAGAGFGTIGVCDSDTVELSNLHRQVLYGTGDLGLNKAQAAATHLQQLNPFIAVNAHAERFNAANAVSLFTAYDIILDCSDNFATKFLANDIALKTGKPLVQASIYQYEGQIHLLHRGSTGASYEGQCLRCLWPDVSAEADELACAVGSCAEVGVLGVVPGTFGTLQALEATKYVLNLPTALRDHVLFIDLLSYETRRLKRLQRPACSSCAPHAVPRQTESSASDAPGIEQPQAATLQKTYPQTIGLERMIVIDVRESDEIQQSNRSLKDIWPHAGILNIPFSNWSRAIPLLDAHSTYLVVCSRGARSLKATQQLRADGYVNAYSLSGGLLGISKADAKTGVATGAGV